jgi:hypothetical protein
VGEAEVGEAESVGVGEGVGEGVGDGVGLGLRCCGKATGPPVGPCCDEACADDAASIPAPTARAETAVAAAILYALFRRTPGTPLKTAPLPLLAR